MYIVVLLDFILFIKYDTKNNFNSFNANLATSVKYEG